MNGYIGLFVALAALIDFGLGVTVDVTPIGKKYIRPDASLELNCQTDQKLEFIIENEVSWYFQPMDKTQAEVKITQTGKVIKDDTKYSLVVVKDPFLSANLKILKATLKSTGKYICRAGGVEGSVEVMVIKDVDRVELFIGDNPPVIGKEINDYEAEFKKEATDIKCTASGSFPEAHIRLFLGDEEITPETSLNAKLIGSEYKSSIVVRKVLYPKHSGKKLRCEASVHLPADSPLKAEKKVSSIPIHIITLVPLISCKNSTASIQDKYVTLECDVSAEKPVKSLFWKLGYNNQIIYPGNKTEDFNEVRVEQIEGSDKNKRVVLDIYKMKKEHFDSIFYLIVEDSNGQIYQEPVYIRQYFNSCTAISQSCILTLLMFICALLLH